jgi:hypothetical protein
MIRVLFLILVVMSSVAFAQTEEKPKAVKFAEFGNATNYFVKKEMESFYTISFLYPKAQLIAINYGANNQIALREKQIQKGLNPRCDFDCPRFTIVRGGKIGTGKIKTVLWIVPSGAENPELLYDNSKQTAPTLKREFIPYRVEKVGKVSDRFFKTIFYEFFEIVKKEQTVNGYIVMRGTESEIESFENRIRKLEFFEFYNSDRIIFLKKIENPTQPTVSLWIAPQSSEFSEELDKK